MDRKIQIFKPEFTKFSVTAKFPCSSPSQSGYKLVSEWLSYFITLRATHPDGKEDYARTLTILRHASFCESLHAEVIHKEDTTGKFVELTLYFKNMDSLNKFIDEFHEKVNNTFL